MRSTAARQPFPNADELDSLARDKLDEIAGRPQLTPPPPQVPMPSTGAPQRDAIAALVDQHVVEVGARIDGLIAQLQAMKQHVLVGSAAAKQTLNSHVDVCQHVDRETDRISTIVDELAQKVLRL